MEQLSSLLKYIGLNVDLVNSSPLLQFACFVFAGCSVALFCFFNIMLYVFAIYITEHKILLKKIANYPTLMKIVNLYRKTRLAYLIFEILLFLINLGGVIWFSFKLIKVLS